MSKHTLFLTIPVLIVLALLAGSSNLFAQGPASSGLQDMVSTAFTYQGQLKDSAGNPVTDTCDLRFSAWDMLSGGGQVGSNCNVTGVAVSNGYFTVQVNAGGEFGGSAFQGEARWLQIAVKCTGDASYTTLAPRQPLTAAPYALGLMPGAKVVGDVSGGAALRAENTALSGSTYGLNGQAASTDGTGVLGWASAISGTTCGVLGRSTSTDGIGVKGRAAAASGTTYGVYGQAVSPDGRGVYGTANIAVEGESSGWLAVYGANTATDTLSTHIGVAGETYGTDIANRNNVAVQGYAVNPAGGIGVRGLAAGVGIAVLGEAESDSGAAYGVYGQSNSSEGVGVYGTNTSTNGGDAIYGQAVSGTGVYGVGHMGVLGLSTRTGGTFMFPSIGVEGESQDPTGIGYGVYGWAASPDGTGVYGKGNTGVYGNGNIGVEGYSSNWITGTGVYGSAPVTGTVGIAAAASGTTYGVYGRSASTAGRGVYGLASADGGYTRGVLGESASVYGTGVYGLVTAASGNTYGVLGQADSTAGTGVIGWADSYSGATYGVYGRSDSTNGYGVYGSAPVPGWAGYFDGNVNIVGTLFKGGGGFKIDDPLDPGHKYLYHSFVESPDMTNLYNGVATLDPDGTAWVQLPDWFQAVNQDFRYQLTCIGGYAPVYIAQEIQGNRFQIGGGMPGLKVSWQVTGIRHDPYAEAHRIPVEQAKPADEQGTYLHPELYGQPASAGVDYNRRPAAPAAAASPAPVPAVRPR